MPSLPKYYSRDIPAYVMEEIITGMIDGNPSRRQKSWRTGLHEFIKLWSVFSGPRNSAVNAHALSRSAATSAFSRW